MRTAIIVAALALAASAQEINRNRFLEGEIRVEGRIQDVIPVDLDLDGKRDMLFTHTSFSREAAKAPLRYISVKWHRGGAMTGKPDQTWIVPPEAATMIFGNHTQAPGIEIGFLTATGAFVWELTDNRYDLTPRRLILNETFFDLAQDDSLPLWWWPVDIGQDGLTDLLLPQHNSYRLYIQTQPGVYGRAFTLDMRSTSTADEGGSAWLHVVKSLPRVETQDVNGDFKDDVCFIWKDQFVYFLQGTKDQENGDDVIDFPPKPTNQFVLHFLQQNEKRNSIATAITYLRDLNRGGGVDFIASYTAGSLDAIDKISTDYYMYLGNGGQPIPQGPQWRIRLPGISINPQLEDINGDGFVDIVVNSFETSTLANAGKIVFQKVPVDYLIFLFDPKSQQFSPEWTWKETMYVDIDKMNAGGGMPQLKFNGDFDGDGRRDLLRLDSDGWLSAARGYSLKAALKKSPIEFEKTDIFKFNINDKEEDGKPDAPKGVDVWDINGDNKMDLMFRWSSRVKVLLSR